MSLKVLIEMFRLAGEQDRRDLIVSARGDFTGSVAQSLDTDEGWDQAIEAADRVLSHDVKQLRDDCPYALILQQSGTQWYLTWDGMRIREQPNGLDLTGW